MTSAPPARKIIHIDMDAFYPSVEQRDNPSLRGKPVVVGGDPKSRGVVSSASYEARKYGIHSAMSTAAAYRLCPHAHFVFPNFDKYVAASRKIREIFNEYTPLVEPLSLDEAYLDVTKNTKNEPYARNIAIEIKQRIQAELNLTASAGVGPNKFIAKLASDMRKPNGLVVVPPEKVAEVLDLLPVEKFWGVGPVTAKKLKSHGLHTAADIRARTLIEMEELMGGLGLFLYDLAHGRDDREVDPTSDPKSCGSETTFDRDINDPKALHVYIREQADEVSSELKRLKRPARTVTLKLKYADFQSVTRSHTLFHPTDDATTISKIAVDLLQKNTEIRDRAVRLIGVSVSNLIHDDEPLQLWFDFELSRALKI